MKNSGKNSKKQLRRDRAKQRLAEFSLLSPTQKLERMAENKRQYDLAHK